jgi:phosphoribosylformylglycinamidine (FGAM) synthase PurS component
MSDSIKTARDIMERQLEAIANKMLKGRINAKQARALADAAHKAFAKEVQDIRVYAALEVKLDA